MLVDVFLTVAILNILAIAVTFQFGALHTRPEDTYIPTPRGKQPRLVGSINLIN
jgi:hypothetical protein